MMTEKKRAGGPRVYTRDSWIPGFPHLVLQTDEFQEQVREDDRRGGEDGEG